MARIALWAGVLLAGSLYPVLRHQPWKFSSEREIVRDIARRHSKVRLLKLEKVDPEQSLAAYHRFHPHSSVNLRWGVLLEVRILDDDFRSLRDFRLELRTHPLLTKSLPGHVMIDEVPGRRAREWWEPPDPPFHYSFLLLEPVK